MTRITTAVHLERPIEEVYDFVTTPSNWPQWHPSSIQITGGSDHSLVVGEQVTEAFLVAGQQGHVVWRAIEQDAPERWVIDGKVVGREMGGVIVYTFKEDGNGTLFEREFTYPTPTLWYQILDKTLVRHRIQRESELAARQLKALLESGRARADQDVNSYYFLNEWLIPASVEEVWPHILNGADYPTWWGKVYEKVESINDLPRHQVGAKAAVQAHGRLPYTIRFTSEVTAVQPPNLLGLKAYGDLDGEGTWRLTPTADGTLVTFEWVVMANKPILRLLAPLMKPLLEANHRWTMGQGEEALKALLQAGKLDKKTVASSPTGHHIARI